jgi:hypothetical protein
MKHHVFINKQHLFQLGYVQVSLRHRAGDGVPKRLFPTVGAEIHLGPALEHLHRDNSGWAVEAVLEEALGCRPPLIDEPLKGLRRQLGPKLSANCPLLLEERAKGRLMEPEQSHISGVGQRMLRAPDTLEVLIVEPIDIRMGVPRIAAPSVDLTPVHRPEVRHHINISFRDVR